MKKLRKEGNNYFIEEKKPFLAGKKFLDRTIEQVFKFAYAMTFGEGEHRDHRSGGSLNRKKGQIFINTFQGKLSELSIYNKFFLHNKEVYQKLSAPDFECYGLGAWDDSDISLEDKQFSIKSTKFYGNLLLLESKDWNDEGAYLPNLNLNKHTLYDYFVLVRIKPDGEKVMREEKLLYSNQIEKERLHKLITSLIWEYDVVGYITHEDLKFLIQENFLLPKGSLLNGKIPMDAENYYVQSGEMRDFKALVERF